MTKTGKSINGKVFEGFEIIMAQKPLKAWLRKAGIKKRITFHSFRHTYASLQLELGTDIYTVQHLLNHKNVSTTQIYASHANPKTREAAGRITLTNVKDDVKTTESKMCPKANKRK